MQHMRTLVLALLTVMPAHAALSQVIQTKVTGGEVSGTAEGGIAIFKGIAFAAPPEHPGQHRASQ
jgi:hypothetical protein